MTIERQRIKWKHYELHDMMTGFIELEREDRITLFKQGSFEVIVTRYTRLFTSEGMFTPDMTVMIPRYEFNSCPFLIYFPRHTSSGCRGNRRGTSIEDGQMMENRRVYKMIGYQSSNQSIHEFI